MTALIIPGETEMGGFSRLYADAEWAVFPVWGTRPPGYCACAHGARLTDKGRPACSRGKHPMLPNGVHDATRDQQQIIGWWRQWPWANIGLPAGANRLAILDVDPAHGGRESWQRLYNACKTRGIDLLDTLTATTGSGGLHAIYAAPAGQHAVSCAGKNGCDGCIPNGQGTSPPFGKDMPGIDTRGHGGYIVAPPSRHPTGGVYAWNGRFRDPAPWPAYLTTLMNPPVTPPPVRRPPPPGAGVARGYGAKALAGECERVKTAPEGYGNAELFKAAARMAELAAGGQLDQNTAVRELLTAATHGGRRGEREALKTIESGMRHGLQKPRGNR